MNKKKTVVVACEVFSSNVGDGVIAETTKHLIESHFPEYCVHFLDISGRENPTASSTQTGEKIKILADNAWSNVLRSLYLRKHYHHKWSQLIKDADYVLIGGGQLMMDNALNFPLKMEIISSITVKHHVPMQVFAVGVGSKWSPAARYLFKKVSSTADSISVRDELSHHYLRQHLPKLQIDLAMDPALFASELYPKRPSTQLIGLGVMTVAQLNRYAQETKLTEAQLIALWVKIAKNLLKRNMPFEFFTNGDPRDQGFAQKVARTIEIETGIDCRVAPRSTTPEQLVHTIQRYQALIASRLHAHIIATSFAIPSVALVWDTKVRAFFKDTNRTELALDIFTADGEQCVRCLEDACHKGINSALVQKKSQLTVHALERFFDKVPV